MISVMEATFTRQLPERNTTSKSKKSKSNPDISFSEILMMEQKKLDNYTYFKCMECVYGPVKPKEICIKCGKCGREFEDDGICKNIPAHPGLHI